MPSRPLTLLSRSPYSGLLFEGNELRKINGMPISVPSRAEGVHALLADVETLTPECLDAEWLKNASAGDNPLSAVCAVRR